jgi:hypothetical protein
MENWNITSEELYMDEAREQALLAEIADEIEIAHEELDVCGHEDDYLMYAPFFNKFMDMDEF